MVPAIFLDRDNTLIENDGDLGDPNAVKLVRGAASAVASLRGLGYKVVVISNQSGVARGKFEEQDVDAVNGRINQLVKATTGVVIDRFYYCPYHPEARVERYRRDHSWRKPKPGMLLQAAKDMDLDLGCSWTIGDQARDVEAGLVAGTRTILLDPKIEGWAPVEAPSGQQVSEACSIQNGELPQFVAHNLVQAAQVVVHQRSPTGVDEKHRLASDRALPIERHCAVAGAVIVTDPSVRAPLAKSIAPGFTHSTTATGRLLGVPQAPSANLSAAGDVSGRATPLSEVGHRPSAGLSPASTRDMLQQILQELRHRRGHHQEFSYLSMLAIVLQMTALVCMLGAFWMDASDQHVFVRWMSAGMLIQLSTIAMLLFQRHT